MGLQSFSRDRVFAGRPAYAVLASVSLVLSLLLGWSAYSGRINQNFSDLFFRQRGPRVPSGEIVIVAIDDATLARYGALPLNRSVLAQAVRNILQARPRLLAVDLLLVDVSSPEADGDLEEALSGATPVVLAAALEARAGGRWLRPLPQFARHAAAIGHAHAEPDSDSASRRVLLEKQAGGERYWAFSLECFRLLRGASEQAITETDETLEVPGAQAIVRVPAARAHDRALWINYAGAEGTFPHVSLASLRDDPALAAQLENKVVLLGVTAQGTGDRLFTPFASGAGMPGVEIHANILNTLWSQDYLQPAGDLEAVAAILAITVATAWALAWFHGIAQAGLLAGIGLTVLAAPYGLFVAGQLWPAFSLLLSYTTALLLCGAYQLLLARRKLTESEVRRRHSQQQFQMAAHEMRTPLTAIQMSSELLSRYSLEESKREQLLRLLYDESQRLGKLVERFLSVERLAAGEMELQRAPVELSSLLSLIAERFQATAERKGIRLLWNTAGSKLEAEADPDLLEFAISNLVTNAIKYSPAGTVVTLSLEASGEQAQVHVADSGAGLTPEEAKRIFDPFYRTEAAARSGAPGFGLGLALAREIAQQHGGDLALVTQPGAGSRFTICLPVVAPAGQRGQDVR